MIALGDAVSCISAGRGPLPRRTAVRPPGSRILTARFQLQTLRPSGFPGQVGTHRFYPDYVPALQGTGEDAREREERARRGDPDPAGGSASRYDGHRGKL